MKSGEDTKYITWQGNGGAKQKGKKRTKIKPRNEINLCKRKKKNFDKTQFSTTRRK